MVKRIISTQKFILIMNAIQENIRFDMNTAKFKLNVG